MRICKLKVVNFRGVKQGCIILPKHAVLLGANGQGKSTIAEALVLLIGRERMLQPLCDWDFFGGSPKPETRFQIVASITDFSELQSNDPNEFPEWFAGENSARPVWWNNENGLVNYDPDPPNGSQLAAEIATAGRYDEETCEFETIRFFYDGDCDPFTDDHRQVPQKRLAELGLFLLPSNREWDKMLTFGSSTFLKVLREYNAVPGRSIEQLKKELRSSITKVEEATPFAEILAAAEQELRSFLLVGEAGRFVYRPTSLDATSVLRSLVPHIGQGDDSLLPVARHGAGLIALQAFLLLLAFGERRKKDSKNFILVAEEPELHLHPSLHSRLVQRIRAASTQSLVTTQSPNVAAGYQPTESIYIRNVAGNLSAMPLRREPVKEITKNVIKKLYLNFRQEFYEALMGGVIIVPEGKWDYNWLRLWQKVAEASPDVASSLNLKPVSFVPTSDAAVVETHAEIAKFRSEAIPLVDGDIAGNQYVTLLASSATPPPRVIQYGQGAATECFGAWVLEPSLTAPGSTLSGLLPDPKQRTLKQLQQVLIEQKEKGEVHESLAWEALENSACALRAGSFFEDIASIAIGKPPKLQAWTVQKTANGLEVYKAGFITKQ